MPSSRAICVSGLAPVSVSRTASCRYSALNRGRFGPIPHLLPRISIEALEVSTKPGELHLQGTSDEALIRGERELPDERVRLALEAVEQRLVEHLHELRVVRAGSASRP